ncbi:MAG: hypothetical protein ACLP81_03120 [Acidimicrobiales bacterium]
MTTEIQPLVVVPPAEIERSIVEQLRVAGTAFVVGGRIITMIGEAIVEKLPAIEADPEIAATIAAHPSGAPVAEPPAGAVP